MSSPIIIANAVARECSRRDCHRPADVEYVHTCGVITWFCDEHRREHDRRTDPARNFPATCARCKRPAPWPMPWTAVPR